MKYTHKSKQILLAAKDVFSEKGFDGASTKEIAQAAGANEVTLFRHFQTKNNLFEEVVANFFIQPTLHYLKENDKTNLYDSLEQVAELMHRLFVENISMIKIEIANISKLKNNELFRKFPNILKDYITQLFMRFTDMDAHRANIAALCFITQIRGLCMSLYIYQNLLNTADFKSCLSFIIQPYR